MNDDDPYFFDEEPSDEELGWGEVPVDIYGNTEEEPE